MVSIALHSKAIGKEDELPKIVDRLTGEVRSLQIRLRDKAILADTNQRRVTELQMKLLSVERENEERSNAAPAAAATAVGGVLGAEQVNRRSSNKMQDDAVSELNNERKRSTVG